VPGAQGRFAFNGSTLELATPAAGDATMGVRPEHIEMITGDTAWRGEVSVVEPTGADTYVVVKTSAGEVTVRTAPSASWKAGDQVGLRVNPANVSWFNTATGVRLGV
jgi:multiple sugar transport system ATP-binding protein